MKNKILFIFGFLAILIIGIGVLIYLTQEHEKIVPLDSSEPPAESQPALEPEIPESEPEEIVEQPTILVKEDFTLTLPYGWQEITQPNTWPIVIYNLREEITDEKAKEIDFQTNLSINRAELAETLPQDYIENVKNNLIQSIPIIEIVKEEEEEANIDSKEANFVEIDSIQEDLNFKTLLVFINKENIIWALSFNTLQESWPEYQEIFYQIAQSFKFN